MTLQQDISGLTLTPINADSKLHQFINFELDKKHKKYKHLVYKFFPDLTEYETLVYWGVFSWSIPAQHKRLLLRKTAIGFGSHLCTPGDLVRYYLDFYHPKKLRALTSEITYYKKRKSAPLYLRASIIPDATYIDITATFWSIVCLTGWDIGYLPNQWFTAGRAPLDFPIPLVKSARNYLVTIGLPTPLTIWNGYAITYRNSGHVHINQGLWAWVMDIIHSIAIVAVSLGAIYVHTDGYIIPSENVELLMQEIRKYNLTPRIVARGETMVNGFGNYMVGDKVTMNFSPDKKQEWYSNIEQVNHNWIKDTIQKTVDSQIPELLYKRTVEW